MDSTNEGVPRQLGVPLDNYTLSAMAEEERAFWLGFLSLAKGEYDEARSSRAQRPYLPSAELVMKYREALAREQDKGIGYCQMRQLEAIFNFSSKV